MKIKVYDEAKTTPEQELYIRLEQLPDRVDIQVVDAYGQIKAIILGILDNGKVRSYRLVSTSLNLDTDSEGRIILTHDIVY